MPAALADAIEIRNAQGIAAAIGRLITSGDLAVGTRLRRALLILARNRERVASTCWASGRVTSQTCRIAASSSV